MQHVENIQLSEEFLALLAKYLTMETSPEENQLVEEWLKQKPANANVLLNINELINYTGGEKIQSDTGIAWKRLQKSIDLQTKPVVVRGRFGKQIIWRVAAGLLILLTAAVLYKFMSGDNDALYYKGIAAVQLKDGTKVQLQKDAVLLLDHDFNSKNRMVTLTGDGSFEVAKDTSNPFTIQLNNRVLTVLGTSFSITQHVADNYFNVKVTEGVVKVKDSLSNNTYKLIAGQELLLSNTEKKVHIVKPFEKLKFNDAAFINILQTMENVYKIKIKNTVPELSQVAYTIDLSAEPLEKALETIGTLTGVAIEKESESVYRIK